MTRSKFGNVRTEFRGRSYDSKAEANYARTLATLVDAGAVLGWSPQVVLSVGPDERYKLDFLVLDADGPQLYGVEVKGKETARWRTVRRLWLKYGLFPLRVVRQQRGADLRFDLVELLEPASLTLTTDKESQ